MASDSWPSASSSASRAQPAEAELRDQRVCDQRGRHQRDRQADREAVALSGDRLVGAGQVPGEDDLGAARAAGTDVDEVVLAAALLALARAVQGGGGGRARVGDQLALAVDGDRVDIRVGAADLRELAADGGARAALRHGRGRACDGACVRACLGAVGLLDAGVRMAGGEHDHERHGDDQRRYDGVAQGAEPASERARDGGRIGDCGRIGGGRGHHDPHRPERTGGEATQTVSKRVFDSARG